MTQDNILLTQIKNNNFTHEIFQQKPVPLMELVKHIGLNGIGAFNSDDEGYGNVLGYVDTEEKLIGINTDESITTQRFTIAHEIAHLALHSDHDENMFYRQDFPTDTRDFKYMPTIEKEANQLAGKILMPKESILKFIKVYKDEEISYQIMQVVKNFSVSYVTAYVRFQELGLL